MKTMLLLKKAVYWAKINILILLLTVPMEKTNEAVHFGKMTHYIPENNVYVYFRYTDNKTVMVLMNNSNEIKTIKTARFQESIKGYTTGKDHFKRSHFRHF
jgi:hypothetical protein